MTNTIPILIAQGELQKALEMLLPTHPAAAALLGDFNRGHQAYLFNTIHFEEWNRIQSRLAQAALALAETPAAAPAAQVPSGSDKTGGMQRKVFLAPLRRQKCRLAQLGNQTWAGMGCRYQTGTGRSGHHPAARQPAFPGIGLHLATRNLKSDGAPRSAGSDGYSRFSETLRLEGYAFCKGTGPAPQCQARHTARRPGRGVYGHRARYPAVFRGEMRGRFCHRILAGVFCNPSAAK